MTALYRLYGMLLGIEFGSTELPISRTFSSQITGRNVTTELPTELMLENTNKQGLKFEI